MRMPGARTPHCTDSTDKDSCGNVLRSTKLNFESLRILWLAGAETRATIPKVLSRLFLMKEHAYLTTIVSREADLAAAGEGGNEIKRNYTTVSQGRHVSSFDQELDHGVLIVEYHLLILWYSISYRLNSIVGYLVTYRTETLRPLLGN